MSRFLRLVSRDLRLALRQGSDATVAVMFFVLCVVLFPFGVGPEANILARIAAGVIWVAALLASLLSLERLFQNDYEDGSLELLTFTSLPLEAVVFAKVLAHWLVTGLPLIVAAPLLALAAEHGACGFSGAHRDPGGRHADAQPDRRHRRSSDAGCPAGRRAAVAADPAALHPCADLRGGRHRRFLSGFTARPHLLLLCGLLVAALPLAPWAGPRHCGRR